MKSILKNFILSALLMMLSFSVIAQKELNQYEPLATYEKGVMLFENAHYASALECFEKYIAMVDDRNNPNVVMAKYYEAVSSLFLGNSKGENKIISFVKEHPTNLMSEHANYLYANTLFNNKKYREAVKVYQNINKECLSHDERYECSFKEAYCYYQTNDIARSTPIFEQLTQSENVYRNDSRYYYAHTLYVDGKHDDALIYFNMIKDDDKYKDIANTYILQINFEKGNYAEVTRNGDEVLDNIKKKNKSDVALMMAEAWNQQNDYAKSLEYYDVALKNNSRKLPREVEFKIGFCKMKTNDYEGALSHFAKVTDSDDELSQYGSYYMAQCYTNTDQDKFARNSFYKAYKMNFNDTISENALLNYAALSFMPGIDPFNETVNILSEYITNNPNSNKIVQLQEMLVYLLLNSNDYVKALETIEQYSYLSQELQQIKSQLTYNAGVQYYKEADYDKSIEYFDKSSQTEALYWKADAYYQKNDDNNALKNYLQFIKSPMSDKYDVYPLAFYNMAYLHFNKADFDNATLRFKQFVEYDKSSDKVRQNDSWMRIGDAYFIQRQYANAITAYSNAVKMDPRNIDYAYYQQAMGYGALGKTNEKINCLNIITTKYQKSSFYDKALYEIGMAYMGTNDNRSAIAAFERIVKEKPRTSYARKAIMKVGMIYYNNDENDKALEKLKDVVKQYPNTDESREALNIISNIYRDKNDVQSYFDYIEKNNLAVISVDKQDSLSFVTIEDFYAKRNYSETLKGAKQYIEKYPDGAYLLKVHYYSAKSMESSDDAGEIRSHLEYIINQPDNDYTDYALLLIARMDYDSSDYSSSAQYYDRLSTVSDNQQIVTEAMEGSMKSYYFNKEYDRAIDKANKLLQQSELSMNQKNQANYILGKSYYDKNDYPESLKYLNIYSDETESGAECRYYAAVCLYNLQRYDEAEEKVYEISDNYGSYIYWTARSFILLSDVYVAKENIFQAKETLKSVIENYPSDERCYDDVLKEAQDKLNVIDKESNE